MKLGDFIDGAFCSKLTAVRTCLLLFFLAVFLTPVSVFSSAAPLTTSDEVRSLIKKAGKLTRDGSLLEAETLLLRAVSLDPSRSESKVELAFVLAKQRRLFDAYEMCIPILEREPKNSRAFAVMGALLLYAGRFSESRRFFTNALTLNRKEHLAWAGIGLISFYENRIDESAIYLSKALELRPDEPDYLFASAQAAGRAERYKVAAEHYEHFLRVSSEVDKDRRDRIKGLIRFLRALGTRGRLYSIVGREQTDVPFELEGDRPIIKLRINDKAEPLRFVLDTGSGISVLSAKTAKRLNISPITKGGYAKGIGGDGKFEIVYGLVRKVSIGDVSINNVPVYLREIQYQAETIDGYIGLALISKFLTTIDYGNQTFSLTRRADDAREFQKSGDISLPLRLTSSGFLSGEVQLEGVDSILNFIVDTGASVSVISERVAKHDGITPFASSEKTRVIGSAGIRDDVSSFLLPKITFGRHSRKSIKAVALDLDLINESSGFEQAGILGGNFLKNYRLTFDFKNSKVVFEDVRSEN